MPVGRTFFHLPPGIQQLPLPAAAMLVVPLLLTHPNGPDSLSHQIGQRSSLQTRITPQGTEVAVTFWSEYRRGSGIWYAPARRDAHRRTRLVPLARCGLLQGTPLRINGAGGLKFLAWRNTTWTDSRTGHQHTGLNSRDIITTTASAADTAAILPHSPRSLDQPDQRCSACLRLANAAPCAHCPHWHHPNCVPICPLPPSDASHGSQLSAYRIHSLPARPPRPFAAGDGSVRNGGTASATGTWSYCGMDGTTHIGQLRIHTDHVTSTRCELHSLLIGLHHTGDAALQICDNTSAIGLVVFARALHASNSQPRYSHAHRVELRSIIALLQAHGTFGGDWVRSHQEDHYTVDDTLRTKRALLAEADQLATLAHALLPLTSYAHVIIPDRWELRDANGTPVLGPTGPWLGRRYSVRDWTAAQLSKPASRRTIQPHRLDTSKLCRWSHAQQNFCWRATCYTLHTHERKHRLYPTWDKHCRTCPGIPDSQEHRFGLTNPLCPTAADLTFSLTAALAATATHWLPDQDIYLPFQCDSAVSAVDTTKPAWTIRRPRQDDLVSNPAVIPTGARYNILGLQALRLTTSLTQPALTALDEQIRWETMLLPRKPYGLILPRWIFQTALRSSPHLALLDIGISQWMGSPNGATFLGPFARSIHNTVPSPPPSHRHWWIDAILRPYTPDWWAAMTERIHTLRNTAPAAPFTVWWAVLAQSPGYHQATAAGVQWFVTIPPGTLRLRSSAAIHHIKTPQWGHLAHSNTKPICIGFIHNVEHTDFAAGAAAHWHAALTPLQAQHWLDPHPASPQVDPPVPTTSTPTVHPSWVNTIHWATLPPPDTDQYAVTARAALAALHPSIFEAPSGWTMFPTMTSSTLRWATDTQHLRAKQTHAAIFNAHWATLHQHWRNTCSQTIAHITSAGHLPLLHEANTSIRAKRRHHDNAPAAHDRRIMARRALLQNKTRVWHLRRTASLSGPPPPSLFPPTDSPIRPPRRPPEPVLPAHAV